MNISKLVISALEEFVLDNNIEVSDINFKTKLFGDSGILDSIGIVMLVTELEEVIEEELSIELTLADDRAMSQKTSPFRTVETLIKYIEKLVESNE
jgi:acyl carrier protein